MSHLAPMGGFYEPPNETYAETRKNKKNLRFKSSSLFPLETYLDLPVFGHLWCFCLVVSSIDLPASFMGMFWLFSLPKGSPRIVENMRHQEIGPAGSNMGWLFLLKTFEGEKCFLSLISLETRNHLTMYCIFYRISS